MNDIQCNSNPEKEDMLLVCMYIHMYLQSSQINWSILVIYCDC